MGSTHEDSTHHQGIFTVTTNGTGICTLTPTAGPAHAWQLDDLYLHPAGSTVWRKVVPISIPSAPGLTLLALSTATI